MPRRSKLSEARGRRGERVALRNVLVPAGTAQLFLIASTEFGWSADQRYDLRVSAELPKAGAEAEPNDDAAHAQAVTDGTVQGYLARGDVDVFRYAVAAPVVLTVEVAPPERATAKLEISQRGGRDAGARASRPGRAASRCGPACRSTRAAVLIRVVAGGGEGNPGRPLQADRLQHGRPRRPTRRPAAEPNDAARSGTRPAKQGEVASGGLALRWAVLVAAALACAHKPEAPSATLQDFGAALARGDLRAAYALTSADFQKRTPVRGVRRRPRLERRRHARRSASASASRRRASRRASTCSWGRARPCRWCSRPAAGGSTARCRSRGASGRRARRCGRSCAPSAQRRYDVVLRLVPRRHRVDLTADKLRQYWESASGGDARAARAGCRRRSPPPSSSQATRRTCPTAPSRRCVFVREDGVWRIEDPD